MWARWETAFLAVFHGVHALFVRSPFIRRRADLADRRMSTPLVIEAKNQTPIVPSRESFGTAGTHGVAGRSGSTKSDRASGPATVSFVVV